MAHPVFDFSQLTTAERAQLAADLWDSIALDPERAAELPVPEEHRAEVARRHAAYLADPDAGAPWEEVEARLLRRLEARRTEGTEGSRGKPEERGSRRTRR